MSSDIGHRPQRIKPAPKPQPPKGIGHVEPTAGLVARWVGASHWSIEDGIALAFGRDPQGIDWQSVPNGYGRCIDLSETVARYRDAARGAIEQGSLPREPRPVDFIPWAESAELLLFHPVWKETLGLPVGWYEEHLLSAAQQRRWLISRWATMSLWTFKEAVCLSLNFSPEEAHEATFDRSKEQLIRDIEHRLKSAQRDPVLRSHLLKDEAPPETFLAWAERSGFPFHPSWDEALRRHLPAKPVVDQEPKPDLLPRERASLLKLVIAMAIKHYRYDPGAKRSNVVANIRSTLIQVGTDLDDKTILSYLREGADVLKREREAE